MNIESTSTVSKSSKSGESSSSSKTSSSDSASFKKELESVSTKEAEETKKAEAEVENSKKTKDAEEDETKPVNGLYKGEVSENVDPYNQLNSEIKVISCLKANQKWNMQDLFRTEDFSENRMQAGLDKQDAAFYLSLISSDNQQITLQAVQNPNAASVSGAGNNDYAVVKNEATQQVARLSPVLMDALTDSMKTNKPIRVDFGNDIAVIMKVDKDGVLSANFIPNTSAVENYLRNNISGLRQAFEDQNLPYNELSYSQQQKKDQNEQQKQNKENNNE